MYKLQGIITAIPTPLLANEDIDCQSLKKLVDYVISQGANGIFVLDNMGEGPLLLDSQKLIAVKAAVEYANKIDSSNCDKASCRLVIKRK